MSILNITLLIISIVSVFAFILLLLKSIKIKQNSDNEKSKLFELENKIKNLDDERTKIAGEKIKFEEKNKKLWSMSEAVHKEKHKVDEQNEVLKTEKEKLQLEKSKVDEKIKKLWQQSTAIHKEKEKINKIKIEVEFKHKEIVDSVNYAKRIQEAILPPIEDISAYFKDSFVLFKPRDIVSGDFYWFHQKDHIAVIAVCDCTGHGVPGAFMSMIGNTLLNQIVIEKNNYSPAIILNLLNEAIKKSLKQTREGTESRDGMDVALVVIDKQKDCIYYAGANRPLYIIDKSNEETFIEYKPTKLPIGGHGYDDSKTYSEHTITDVSNKIFYLFSDGFADQFGGNKGKKFMLKNLQRMLVEIKDFDLNKQYQTINQRFYEWKEGYDQVDDVLLIGFTI